MSIVTLFEQLASTTHHKVNFEELLKEEHESIQRMLIQNDASSLKAHFQ
ncbi:MAG: hypothetical protein QM652_03085 [Legionella sp.]